TWGLIYFKLKEGVDPSVISNQLEKLVADEVPPIDDRKPNDTIELSIVNLLDAHLYSEGRNYTIKEIGSITQVITFSVIAGLILLIGCINFMNLSTARSMQRAKEISMRKVHGASVFAIVKLLIIQFSKPVLISNIIAWPVAWYFMTNYLNGFTFRIDLAPSFFIGTGIVALIIAWITTTHHAIKAAKTSPAVVLKAE
ncbi:MAG: hypothetical protein P8P98_07200, partial [Emcibacteraceae bacterium]|nr:hypothetical protein [Emcibacteraceae bacterium]